jgi:hypothetical protein
LTNNALKKGVVTQKFEYKCVAILGAGQRTTRILNEYAQDDWELVATWWCWFHFKRPLV